MSNINNAPVSIFSARPIPDAPSNSLITYRVPLTSDERRKSIISFMAEGKQIQLQLFGSQARGAILKHGNLVLIEETAEILEILAKPEPVMTATTPDFSLLLRSAYHLGNRHVPIEITLDWLRFSPDPVLKNMLEQMGLVVSAEIAAFEPEAGAYHSHG
ncbi:MAG: urease accessory protein UreE [Pseudanabaenaceae cyanobacterium bins.68]|nr:urease accessory protein UreE [Pseudanabaenaceae cyanobacterium bins.68]